MVTSLLLVALLAAEGASPTPPVPLGEARPLVLEGKPGIWLPLQSARRLLEIEQQHRGCELLNRRIFLLEDLVTLRLREIVALKEQQQNERAMSDALKKQLEEANVKIGQLEATATKWYRNPYALLLTGLAVGSVSTIVLTR